MFVTVSKKKVPVGVSDGGVFHDKTGKYTATTLRGLEQKMNRALQVQGNVPVEKVNGSRQGTVVSHDPEYNKYKVRWDNGRTTHVYSRELRRRTTAEEKQHLADLEGATVAAEEVATAAYAAVDTYISSLAVDDLLKHAFGD